MIYKKYNTTPSQTPQHSNPCSPLSSWSAFNIGWLLWAQAINWNTGRVKSGLHTTTQCLDGKGMPQSWALVSSLADGVLLWKWQRVWEEQGRDVAVVWQHPIACDKVEHSINTAKHKLQLPPCQHTAYVPQYSSFTSLPHIYPCVCCTNNSCCCLCSSNCCMQPHRQIFSLGLWLGSAPRFEMDGAFHDMWCASLFLQTPLLNFDFLFWPV